jgi:hypothetical protein
LPGIAHRRLLVRVTEAWDPLDKRQRKKSTWNLGEKNESVPSDERDAPRATMIDVDSERIRRKPVLGGLMNEYTHAA